MTAMGLPDGPARLLADYTSGSFFFASPRRTLLTEGSALVLPGRDDDLPAYADAVLGSLAEEMPDPIVVGAVPFTGTSAAHLIVPARVRYADPITVARLPAAPVRQAPVCQVRPVPEPEEYLRGVSLALDLLADGRLGKVVLARSLHVTAAVPIDVRHVLGNLARRDPHGYTFAAGLPSGRTLLGASPELLVSRLGSRVIANPMAGTIARGADPGEDGRRAAALRGSAKDLHEHAVVVDAVVTALKPFLKEVHVPARPTAVPTATLWHLASRVTGELADTSVTSLDLALALHPTPAICGVPVDSARAAIAEIEPFGRGFYAGMVGWMDAAGDGEWAVTIRCGEADDRSLRLYAGAGIVAGSRPGDELAETSAKFRTLLSAMGLREAELDDLR